MKTVGKIFGDTPGGWGIVLMGVSALGVCQIRSSG